MIKELKKKGYKKIMTKMLDVIGLILVAIMSLGFMGILQPTIKPGLSPLFWGCAGVTLLIIIYRKKKKKQEESES
jgi:FtsH-binding integral membrane protein